MNRNQEIEFLEKMAKSLANAANEIQSVFAEFEKNEPALESDYEHCALEGLIDNIRDEESLIEELIDELKVAEEEE